MTSVKETQTQEEKADTRIQFSIRWKVLLGFTVLFTVVYFLAMSLFTSLAINSADRQIQEDLTQALMGAASGVDVPKLLDLAATGEPNEALFTDDPRFEELLDWLDTVHTAEPDAWPYLYIPGPSDREIYFVVDLLARYDTESAGKFMEVYESSSGYILEGFRQLTYRAVDRQFIQDMKNAAKENSESAPWLSDTLNNIANWLVEKNIFPKREFGTYGDKYGRWASGYMPLTDERGTRVAAIGLDFEAATVNAIRDNVRSSVQRAFLIAYPVLLVVVFWFSSFFTRPLVTLSAAAGRVGEGDYDVDFSELISDKWRDEIDTLASVFALMVKKVYQREQHLRQQVARLRIEIDQTKKQDEVSQIVETDFFRHLQNRANKLRSSRGTDASEDETSDEGKE